MMHGPINVRLIEFVDPHVNTKRPATENNSFLPCDRANISFISCPLNLPSDPGNLKENFVLRAGEMKFNAQIEE